MKTTAVVVADVGEAVGKNTACGGGGGVGGVMQSGWQFTSSPNFGSYWRYFSFTVCPYLKPPSNCSLLKYSKQKFLFSNMGTTLWCPNMQIAFIISLSSQTFESYWTILSVTVYLYLKLLWSYSLVKSSYQNCIFSWKTPAPKGLSFKEISQSPGGPVLAHR